MINNNDSIINYYQKELEKIVWRLQYKAKSKCKRETTLTDYIYSTTPTQPNFHDENYVHLMDLINRIPFETGKQVIYKIYVQDKSESIVAKELNISQQAVNKWKKKSLRYLYQKIDS